jgi:hypothetical protein
MRLRPTEPNTDLEVADLGVCIDTARMPICPPARVISITEFNTLRQPDTAPAGESLAIDDAAVLGGVGASASTPVVSAAPGAAAASSPRNLMVAQNWLDLSAERGLSSFDQRHLVNATIQYTTGMGMAGGTLLSGWRGTLFKGWMFTTTISAGHRTAAHTFVSGAERTLIDFIGEIKDDYGSTIQNVRDKADIKLSGETAAKLAKQPIEYDTGFTLLPGKYKIKFLARDLKQAGWELTKPPSSSPT